MLKRMTEVTNDHEDHGHIIGGQIWLVDKELNLDKIKNVLNIVGNLFA